MSGYRSPTTNATLRKKSGRVSKNSLHRVGKAIDVRLRDISTRTLRNLAVALEQGGVGYYRKSDFVHIDTGRVGTW
ncbi:MAG: YcbK family protein [Methylococcales bacterium]